MKLLLLGLSLSSAIIASSPIYSQDQSSQQTEPPAFTADCPTDRAGIFIQGLSQIEMKNEMPSKTKAAHGIAASFSYGIVPAKLVAEYAGEYAQARVKVPQPVISICHMLSLPGEPVIVRLHSKKGVRELDGGKMVVYPILGGSKSADANKSDLIPTDQKHPEPQIWHIRPQSALPPGEYALMLGTQNMSIFSFAVSASSSNSGASE